MSCFLFLSARWMQLRSGKALKNPALFRGSLLIYVCCNSSACLIYCLKVEPSLVSRSVVFWAKFHGRATSAPVIFPNAILCGDPSKASDRRWIKFQRPVFFTLGFWWQQTWSQLGLDPLLPGRDIAEGGGEGKATARSWQRFSKSGRTFCGPPVVFCIGFSYSPLLTFHLPIFFLLALSCSLLVFWSLYFFSLFLVLGFCKGILFELFWDALSDFLRWYDLFRWIQEGCLRVLMALSFDWFLILFHSFISLVAFCSNI